MTVPAPEVTPLALAPLPLGQVKPAGWLRRQLDIQASGLSGHLDEFWPDVARSAWIGGDRDGWERGPYWLDGLVPLAFLLNDDRLIEKADRWVNAVLERQHEDGWLGSTNDVRITGSGRVDLAHDYDPWPRFVVLKALTQYQEATGDARIVPALLRYSHRLAQVLAERPLRSWGRYRWADLALSLLWRHERTGEEWLLDLAATAQTQGYHWPAHYERFSIRGRCLPEERDLSTHVVNNAMGLKDPGLRYRLAGNPADRDAVATAIATLDRWHGQATGVFSGDEHLAGRNPSQGTELCAVVEYMYSLETLIPILGDPAGALADRLERIAYNALPATISADMWTHQYVQQVNQAVCAVSEDRLYTSNGPDANIFGLEPHFGCCLANMHQGWPKFASHLWMRTADDGLAAVAWAPCTVETEVRNVPVRVTVETDYPFDGRIALTVEPAAPVRFPLKLRIPAWAEGATLTLDGGEPTPGAFHEIDRDWTGPTTLVLDLPLHIRIERRDGNSAVIHRGPLLLAHPIGGDWRKIGGEDPHADWEVHPTSPWSYALVLPNNDPAAIQVETGPVGAVPFGPDTPPLTATVPAVRIDGWDLAHNAAGPLPESPVPATGPVEPLRLVPYGATTLRITQFPMANDRARKLATK